MDDQTLEGGDGEEALDLELELEEASEEETQGPGSDPLDDIKDPVARAEAKKYRAIARRNTKEVPEAKVPAAPASSEFLTKADFYKTNERVAIKAATADPEVKANWAEIVPFYTPRRGKETTEDIAEDIQDAITLYKARNPEVVTDDSKNTLTETAVVKTGGGPIDKVTAKTPDLPGFKLPIQADAWYPKKPGA